MDSSENESMDKTRTFFAEDIHNNTNWIKKVISKLSDNVYITIDLDVFDPSIMPSTGTPEPGGLLWYDVLAFLKEVSNKRMLWVLMLWSCVRMTEIRLLTLWPQSSSINC
jgi:agmatinase